MDGKERFKIDMMTKDEANQYLSREEKEMWIEFHNRTANLYVLRNGRIEDVPATGWWY